MQVYLTEVIFDAVLRPFAAHAGFLHTSERRNLCGYDALVDAYEPVF